MGELLSWSLMGVNWLEGKNIIQVLVGISEFDIPASAPTVCTTPKLRMHKVLLTSLTK